MKKSTTAIATLVAIAGLAGATTVSAHAYPANHTLTSYTSKAATTRLHSLLETSSASGHQTLRMDDFGSGQH